MSVFKKAKKSRNELYLPSMRYIVADDWIDKLGHEAFIAWIKFHTWVDRTDEQREHDRIPYSLEDTWNKLGMSKSKFYRTVIRPLWNYGLIDIIEYKESKRKTQKPKNIVVYDSPFNLHETEIKPLEQLRDYSTDYNSSSQAHGRKGGRPQKSDNDLLGNLDGFKNETVGETPLNGFKNETVDGFKNETVTVSKMKPNNVSNISNNVSNDLNNLEEEEASSPTFQNLYQRIFNEMLTAHQNESFKLVVNNFTLDEIKKEMEHIKSFYENKQVDFASVLYSSLNNGGWVKSGKSFKKGSKRSLSIKKEKLPKAIIDHLENQESHDTLNSHEHFLNDTLEEKQARIKAKLEAMNARFMEKQKANGEN